MNRLYEVEDGACYWVVASSEEQAKELVRALPDFDPDGDGLWARAIERPDDRAWQARYISQDGETCSMRLAFELCRAHPQIIAGSEWP